MQFRNFQNVLIEQKTLCKMLINIIVVTTDKQKNKEKNFLQNTLLPNRFQTEKIRMRNLK